MDWQTLADELFPGGHDVREHDDVLFGPGRCASHEIAVIGTAHHAALGVQTTLALSAHVLATIREHPGRPLLLLLDTSGQRLRRHDEMLGLARYLAHLAKSIEVARMRGHRVLGLVYGLGLSGGILATAFCADLCGALPEAEVRAMQLETMARITRINEERLRELGQSSPLFARQPLHFVRMGALEPLPGGDLALWLQQMLERAEAADRRSQRGFERGGRQLAYPVMQRVANDD